MAAPGGAHAGQAVARRPEHFADPTSWGYRLAGRLDYNNAIGAWNAVAAASPGSTTSTASRPGPGGNFIEGLKALTLGLGAELPERLGARPELHQLHRAPAATI